MRLRWVSLHLCPRPATLGGALTAALCVLALWSPAVQGQEAPAFGIPPDVDARPAVPPESLTHRREAVARAVDTTLGPGVVAHWGDRSDRPVFLWKPGGALATLSPTDPVGSLRRFLADHPALFGLTREAVDALVEAKRYRTAATGWTHVILQQTLYGVRVYQGQIRATLDAEGDLLNLGGEWFPGLSPDAPEPTVAAEDALGVAIADLGLPLSPPPVASRESHGERRTRFEKTEGFLAAPEGWLLWLPEGPDTARLVWNLRVWEDISGADHLYRVQVDARSGEVVLRELLTRYAAPTNPADATGMVFNCEHPDACGQTIESFAGDPTASPAFWVEDRQTETRGNNIVCRADWSGGNLDAENPLADGGRRLEFHFSFTNAYETSGDWGADMDAAITNAFYWGNLIHDHWYALGFDEAAGNYQDDNFGRGGLGNDHVNVDVQDSASLQFVRNNANWSPTNDGSSPRTNYFLWTNPNRDGAFGAKVIWHEFGHGISTRLVGGPDVQCLSGAQGGGMGEGWGDWFAINYFNDAGDDPAGPEVIGEYVAGNPNGIRRYPYAYDMALDPLTYADLCDGGSCAVHDEGEIWASALWDVRHDLIQTHGLSEGKLRAEQLVVDSMKLSPCSPNFVVMRDAMLQADENRYAGEDVCLLRAAFARRGLGAGASSNGTGADATADFETITPLGPSLRMAADKATLQWEARSDAVGYRVARGTFSTSGAPNTFDNAVCLGEVATPEFSDPDSPPPGEGFYYVTAVRDGCFVSHYGRGSSGSERSVVACP